MAEIIKIRQGIAKNLGTIPGLRVYTEYTDSPNYPAAVINLDSVDYDGAFKQGLTTYNFVVSVIVGRAAEREMQRKLDAYCQPSGPMSVKEGVESDRSLSGEIYDLRVTGTNSIGSLTINDQTYLAAEFTVTVFA